MSEGRKRGNAHSAPLRCFSCDLLTLHTRVTYTSCTSMFNQLTITCLYRLCQLSCRVWAADIINGRIRELHRPQWSPQVGRGSKLFLLPEPQQPEKTFSQHLARFARSSLFWPLQTVMWTGERQAVQLRAISRPLSLLQTRGSHHPLPFLDSYENHNQAKRGTVHVGREAEF